MAKSSNSKRKQFLFSPLFTAMLLSLSCQPSFADDDELEFDSSFLQLKNKKSLNLKRFARMSNLPAGIYKTSLYLND